MSRRRVLAVTGATGRIGGMVAGRLAQAGLEQRLVVRDPSRAPSLSGAEIVTAEYGDAAAARRALAGADTLFMVSAAESADRAREHLTFLDAAASAGVSRIVYLSFCGAAADATFTLARDHWATEEHLRRLGVAHTILRDNLYADFVPMLVGADGNIRGPGGDGRAAMVAQGDVAEVATAVLASDGAFDGRVLDLSGPAAVSLAEAATLLGRKLGHPVSYIEETVDEAYASRAVYGAPPWLVDAWVSTYRAIAAGDLDRVSATVEEVTGHAATSLEQVLGL